MKKIINELELIQKKLMKSNQGGLQISVEMNEHDVETNKKIESYAMLSNKDKANFEVSNDIAWLLLGFGFSMATYSLRLSDQRYFNNGLIAIEIASKTADLRDALKLLSLYWYVHKEKELSFEYVLSQKSDFANELQKFLNRSELDKSLESMGFELTGQDDGIQFSPKKN